VGRAPDLARSEGVGGGVGGARVSKALDRAAARPSRAGPINAPIAMSISLRATRSSGSTPFVISILQQGFNARGSNPGGWLLPRFNESMSDSERIRVEVP
jgi:hypothetical protein